MQGVDLYTAFADGGVDPKHFPEAPTVALPIALEKAGLKPDDIATWEVNEAFSVVVRIVEKVLGVDPSKINVNGGAIAIGHPIGASGCRILVTLLHEMVRRDARKGLASLCIGGGMGVALAVER